MFAPAASTWFLSHDAYEKTLMRQRARIGSPTVSHAESSQEGRVRVAVNPPVH